MAIFRGAGGAGDDNSSLVLMAVKDQIDIATEKVSEAATKVSEASAMADKASEMANEASAMASEASARASVATREALRSVRQASKSTTMADAAELAYSNFDTRYLGAKTREPIVDNVGDPLLVGAVYYDTVSNSQLVWNGTVWKSTFAPTEVLDPPTRWEAYDLSGTATMDSLVTESISDKGEGLTLNIAGNLVLDASGDVDVKRDLIVGGGIQLGGTGSQNLLEDYEEGTFTPYIGTWRGGVPITDSRAVFSGSYTKIGRSVTCQINIYSLWLTGTTSGILVIKGLPFTPSYLGGSTQYQAGALGAVNRLKFARKDNTAFALLSTVGLGIESTKSGGSYAWENNSIVLGASIIRGSITYFTDE